MVAEEDGGGRDALLLGNLDDGFGGHHGTTGTAQGAVGNNVDALLLAVVDNLLLGQAGVVLNLVDGGDDGGVGQKLLEVLDAVLQRCVSLRRDLLARAAAYVADADGLGLAGGDKLLHLLPGVDVVVGADDVSRAIGVGGELVVVT